MSQVFGRDPDFERQKSIEPITTESASKENLAITSVEIGYWPPSNTGHGHVFKRLDGVVARCGGPRMCPECAKDLAAKQAYEAQICSDCPPIIAGTISPTRCLTCPRRREEVFLSSKAIHTTDCQSNDMRVQAMLRLGITPRVLRCPVCSGRHIDEPNPAIGWLNPPHRTHLCNHCGNLWRPHEFLNAGVTDEEYLEFLGMMSDEDWRAAISMAADDLASRTPEQRKAQQIVDLEADGFQRIGTQMDLYAGFFKEPCDQVDHIRLWYVDNKGNLAQGDSITWTTLLRRIFTVMEVPEEDQTQIITDLGDSKLIPIEKR